MGNEREMYLGAENLAALAKYNERKKGVNHGFSLEFFESNKQVWRSLAHGIEPCVTLYHWDLPQSLQDIGGWTNPIMADYFAEYAEVAFTAFGDRVKMWLTLNEPAGSCVDGYGGISMAPALNYSGIGEYLCVRTMIKAHTKAYRLYEKKFKTIQKGRISLTMNSYWFEPSSENSADAAERGMQFELGWFAHPIFSLEGDYPQIMKAKIRKKSKAGGFLSSRLPKFTPEEIDFIRGSYDFFGVNHYTSSLVKDKTYKDKISKLIPSIHDDKDTIEYPDPSWPDSASSWLKVVPWGITKLLGWIRTHYGNPELIIFENGFSDRGGLQDEDRVDYYHLYLNAVLDAIDQGSNVTAFTAWSLMDNFEWLSGYTEHFGLYEVNFDDDRRTRTPKMSAAYYKEIVKTRSINQVLTDEILDRISYRRQSG